MYDVILNDSSVGFAQVERQGLYYIFQCCCKFTNSEIYRIKVSDGKMEIMLGVCVPEEDQFVLRTKIPTKYLQGGNLYFTAESRNENGVLVTSGQPFSYIDKLETARLQTTNGQPRIIIGQSQDPQDSGQSRESPNIWGSL